MAAAYVVTIPAANYMGTRHNGVDTCVVWAATSADAIAMAKCQFDGDSNADWAAATATAMAAGTDLSGFAMRIRVTDKTYDPDDAIGSELLYNVTVLASDTAGVKATGTLTTSAQPVNTNTVTIGSNVYVFQDVLTNVAGHVKIGASEAATLVNLFHAVNASGGTAGVDYATATVAHPSVEALGSTAHTVSLRALAAGVAGNAIATTDTLATGGDGFGAATLTGGVSSATFDSFGAAAVVALEAAGGSALTPSYNASTQTLTVAAIADAIGDHQLDVDFYDASKAAKSNVPGYLGATVDEGIAGAVLTIVLGADAYSLVSAAVKLSTRQA